MERKGEIRKSILMTRAALTHHERQEKSRVIQEKVLHLPEFKTAANILLYMDYHEEVQTGLLLQECFLQKKRVGLPKVMDDTMEFYELRDTDDVRPGFCRIQEPVSEQIFDPERALVIVPGVVFSPQRMRIGYGKGFYDKYLQRHNNYVTCGIAYDCQIVEQFQIEKHDVSLDRIITETKML